MGGRDTELVEILPICYPELVSEPAPNLFRASHNALILEPVPNLFRHEQGGTELVKKRILSLSGLSG